MIDMKKDFGIYSARLLPQEELFTPGHRACQGCGPAVALRLIGKALGRNSVIVNATGCMEIVASPYPHSAWKVPWMHVAFENTAAVASGIEAGIKVLRRKGRHFTDDRKINILALAGDGGTMDIGVQALSGAMERGHDMMYICYDNEAYMNTGIQRSSGTPMGASTTTSPAGKASLGQKTWKKDLPAIMVAHHIPYVATASLAHPFDLYAKVKKGLEIDGPAYVHIFAPCPTGWRCAADMTIRLCEMAVNTGIFPLYEVIDGKYTLSFDPGELAPIKEYVRLQGRFRHLPDEEVERLQERIHENFYDLRTMIQCQGR